MRVFLELVEVPSIEGVAGEVVQVDVSSWLQEAIDSKVSELRLDGAKFAGFVLRLHRCFHDEGKPCEVEIL